MIFGPSQCFGTSGVPPRIIRPPTRQFAEVSTEARDKFAAIEAARRQVADQIDATAKERGEAISAFIGGEAEIDAIIALDTREQALRRLAAEFENEVPELKTAADAEREWERNAPARAERTRKEAEDRARREKIWNDPRNAMRRFQEVMGSVGPEGYLEDRIIRQMGGLVRPGNPKADEPAYIISNAEAYETWLAEEGQHLRRAQSWGDWIHDLVKRRQSTVVCAPSNGFNPGWFNRQD